jgi:hypothetical protein
VASGPAVEAPTTTAATEAPTVVEAVALDGPPELRSPQPSSCASATTTTSVAWLRAGKEKGEGQVLKAPD